MNTLASACLAAVSLVVVAASAHGQMDTTPDLAGLWQAKGRFGPDVAGRLVLDRPGGAWRASIAGRTAPVRMAENRVSFQLPDGSGSFTGTPVRATRRPSRSRTTIPTGTG